MMMMIAVAEAYRGVQTKLFSFYCLLECDLVYNHNSNNHRFLWINSLSSIVRLYYMYIKCWVADFILDEKKLVAKITDRHY